MLRMLEDEVKLAMMLDKQVKAVFFAKKIGWRKIRPACRW